MFKMIRIGVLFFKVLKWNNLFIIYWFIRYLFEVELKILYKLWIKNNIFIIVIDLLVRYFSFRSVGFNILFDILNIMKIL